MKFRRTLPAAAAAATLVPAVLLTASAAHADGGPTASPSAGASSPAASASPSASASPTSQPPSCNNGPSSLVHFTLRGLPATVTAGGGWQTFTMTAADTSDTAAGPVEASVTVDNGSPSENGDLYLHGYLEYWDAGHGKWLTLKDEGKDEYRETGIIYGYTDLKAHQSAVLKFRLRVDSKATPGSSEAVGGGTYLDPVKHCTDGSTTDAQFTVVAPGGKGGTRPQGGESSSPVPGGGLADTGSSSALPWLAAAGGAAVLAGAGTVFTVRRRRGGPAAG